MTMKTKKTLQHIAAVAVVLLTLCLVFAVPVSAEGVEGCPGGETCEHVAAIGKLHYDTLEKAIDDAAEGATIKLADDVSMGKNSLKITDKSIVLDLNGYTIRNSDGSSSDTVTVSGNTASLTVQDTNATKTGKIETVVTGYGALYIKEGAIVTLKSGTLISTSTHTSNGIAVYVGSTRYGPGTFVMDGGKVDACGTGIMVANGTVTINGGEIAVRTYGISGNGGQNNGPTDGTTITITGGTITSGNGVGIYHPQDGTLIVSGGKITGPNGIQFVGDGILTISGGEISGTLNNEISYPILNSNGKENNGAALSIVKVGPKKDGTASGYGSEALIASITGGTFTSTANDAIRIYGNETSGGQGTKDVTLLTSLKFISGGTFSSDVSAYVEEDYICIQEAESKFVVQEKSGNTVVPDVPATSETKTEDGKTTTTITAGEGTTVKKEEAEGVTTVTIAPAANSESAVNITITGAGVEVDENNKVTVPESATIKAEYKEADAETEDTSAQANAVTFTLSVNISNVTKPLPVIDATMLTDEKKDKVKDESGKQIKKFLAAITALGDNDKNGVNDNLAGTDDAVTIVINVHKSLVDNPHLMAALHLDKDGNPKQGSNPKLTWKLEDEYYVVTITGKNFSSYVLVEEEPQDNLGGGSAVDTGSGNYQYYPRSVPTDGIVDFGTSKVVTGMELPAGSDGTVTLNIKPTFAMPENGFYAFEIDAPGYNLDAKINGGLSFQIPVADLEAAGWTAEDIVLFHGTVAEDGKITWEALPTNLVKNENGVVYYKAAIAGCSPFYIGFVKDGSVVNTEVVDPVTPETPVTPDEPEVLPPVDEPETPEQPTESPAPILAVLAGLGAAAVLRRK